MSEPLANTLHPLTDATITIRIIRNFTYRTMKSLVLHHVDLNRTTVSQLKELIGEHIKNDKTFKIYQPIINKLDTLKLYTQAHGYKSMNLIINLDRDDELILNNDEAILSSCKIEHETELSYFNMDEYKLYQDHPENKWE